MCDFCVNRDSCFFKSDSICACSKFESYYFFIYDYLDDLDDLSFFEV